MTVWVGQCVLISVLRALHTQQCTFLSVTQSPHRRDPIAAPPLLCHFLPSVTLPPSILPPFTLHLWLTLSVPPHISQAVPSLKHGVLQIFISPALDLSILLPSSLASFHFSPLLPFSPTLQHTTALLFALSIIASWPTLNRKQGWNNCSTHVLTCFCLPSSLRLSTSSLEVVRASPSLLPPSAYSFVHLPINPSICLTLCVSMLPVNSHWSTTPPSQPSLTHSLRSVWSLWSPCIPPGLWPVLRCPMLNTGINTHDI